MPSPPSNSGKQWTSSEINTLKK